MVLRKNLCPLPATLPPSLNPKSGMTPGGSHMTPGGPSVTPGGPSMMPGPNIAAPAMTPPVAQPIIAQHSNLQVLSFFVNYIHGYTQKWYIKIHYRLQKIFF